VFLLLIVIYLFIYLCSCLSLYFLLLLFIPLLFYTVSNFSLNIDVVIVCLPTAWVSVIALTGIKNVTIILLKKQSCMFKQINKHVKRYNYSSRSAKHRHREASRAFHGAGPAISKNSRAATFTRFPVSGPPKCVAWRSAVPHRGPC